MFEIFIRRPILSGVISVVIVFLGLLAINSLPITQFPDIVPPSVTVTARYTGANADVMAKTVATPLERAINGVPGMTYMTSVCTNDGMSLTTIYFKVGTDPDVASVNVQNRVTTVLDELPEEVIRAGVITEKEVNSMLYRSERRRDGENGGDSVGACHQRRARNDLYDLCLYERRYVLDYDLFQGRYRSGRSFRECAEPCDHRAG